MPTSPVPAGPAFFEGGTGSPSAQRVATRGAGSIRQFGLWAASFAAATYLLVGLALPLVVTVQSSVAINPFWAAYSDQLTSSSVWTLFERTLLLAALTTAITVFVGYPVAYAMTLMGQRLRSVILVLVVLPYLTSFLVRTYAWIGILGTNGPVVKIVQRMGGDTVSYNGTVVGVLAVLVQVFLPVVILTCYVSMSRVEPSHLRAARTLGANHLESFWRVYAPQTVAGVVSGCALVFISSAGMYATPALIGGPALQTVVTRVVEEVTQALLGVSPAYPAALTVILAAVVALVLAVSSRFVGMGELLGLASPRERRRRQPHKRRGTQRQARRPVAAIVRRIPGSGRHHILVRGMVVFAVLVIDGPFVYLIGMSFQPLPLLAFPTGRWSLMWYNAVLEDQSWSDAARQSVQIALLATVVALIVGTFLALRTSRLRAYARGVVVAAALLPLIMPSVLYATGIFTLFTELNLIGNWMAIGVVHSVLALPFVYVNVLNGLNSYDPRWDEAASSLGASPWRRLRKVKIPMLRPALITGAFLAVLTSIDEFTVTLFMGGIGFQTLPLKFWSGARENLSPELAVVGVLLTGMAIAVAALAGGVSHRARAATKH